MRVLGSQLRRLRYINIVISSLDSRRINFPTVSSHLYLIDAIERLGHIVYISSPVDGQVLWFCTYMLPRLSMAFDSEGWKKSSQ